MFFFLILELFLQRAWEQWTSKNEKYAIFYQTISFCLQNSSYRENEDIFQYIEKLRKELRCSSIEKPVYNENFSDINKYLEKEITSACRQFPKEWTVLQLCKNFNPYALSSKYEDIASFNTGISMTIFKHSAIKDMLMLEIRKQAHLENLFEKVYRLNKMISEHLKPREDSYSSNEDKQTFKEKYWKTSEKIEKYIQDIVNLLSAFIGPWVCALSGNFKNRKSIEMENEIRKKVYEFLCKRDFNDYQKKLIHLVARRTDLLSNQQIFVAITYILRDKSNLGYNDIDLNDLYDYLTWIKQEYKYEDTSTHPCILIIDEFLDQMPFEMINTHQEYTRMCSFSNLKQMWERHSSSMDNNGYVVTSLTNCSAVVNPDNTLTSMEERMKNFFNYWLPSWKVVYNQNITKDSFYELLTQSDVFVYAGHGSGLNLSFSDSVYNLKTKSTIVLLFGCASTGLTSSGLNSELKGAHYFYHLGSCPSGSFFIL
jgi:separase